MINGKSVSLCLVVYNGSELVRRCKESVKPIIDETIIVDQGSDMENEKVLKELSDFHIKTTNKGNADYDRQYCYSFANKDLILALDADESFLPEDLVKLQNIKEDYDLMWFLFNNTISYQETTVNIKDLLGDDPHPRLWKVRNAKGQAIVNWKYEAHQFPDINTDKQLFSNIYVQHHRLLENVIATHLRRGRNIDPRAQQLEKDFVRAVLEKFGSDIKKQLIMKISGLADYLKG